METSPVQNDGVVDTMVARVHQRRQAQFTQQHPPLTSSTGDVIPPLGQHQKGDQHPAEDDVIDLTSDIPSNNNTSEDQKNKHKATQFKSSGNGIITSAPAQPPSLPAMAYRQASITNPSSLSPIASKTQNSQQQQKSIIYQEKSIKREDRSSSAAPNSNNNASAAPPPAAATAALATSAPQPNKAALQAVIHGMGHTVYRVGSMEPPDGTMSVNLMPHQRQALAWMYKREARTTKPPFGGILADDQGLGKTVSTIALIMTAPPDLRREEQQARQAAFSAAALGNTRKEQAMRKKMMMMVGMESTGGVLGGEGVIEGSGGGGSSDSAGEAVGGDGDGNKRRKRAPFLAGSATPFAYGTDGVIGRNNDTSSNQQQQQSKARKVVIHGGTLIICPTSVINQWAEELNAKVSPSANLSVHTYHGKNKSMSAAALAQFDVVLTTYATLSLESPPFVPVTGGGNNQGNNGGGSSSGKKGMKMQANGKTASVVIDLTNNNKLPPTATNNSNNNTSNRSGGRVDIVPGDKPNHHQQIEEYKGGPLFQLTWHRVVLDEAQIIKNARTQGAQATWKLKARRRWCLSGTPIQNTIDDLYSLFRFLRYDPYDNINTFKSLISNPIASGDPLAFKRLQAVLNGVLLRRTKDSKINGVPIVELPDKKHKAIQVEFSPEERAFYDSMYNQAMSVLTQLRSSNGGAAPNYANMLWLLLRLRQACNHPALLKDSFNSCGNRGHSGNATNGGAASSGPNHIPSSSDNTTEQQKQHQQQQAKQQQCGNVNSTVMKNQVIAARKLPSHLLDSMTSALNVESTTVQCVVCGDVPEHASVSICTHIYCEECLSSQFGANDTYGDIEPGVCPAFDCLVCGNTLTPGDVFFGEALKAAGGMDTLENDDGGHDGGVVVVTDTANGTTISSTTGTAMVQNPFLSSFTSSSKVIALMRLLRKVHNRPEDGPSGCGDDGDAGSNRKKGSSSSIVETDDEQEEEREEREGEETALIRGDDEEVDGKEEDMEEIDLSDIDEDNYAEYKHILTRKQRKKLKKKFRKRKRSRSSSYGGNGGTNNNNGSKRQDKTIVFSQWTGMLDLIQAQVQQEFQCRRLDGSMSVAQRSAAISDFSTNPAVTILLVSLKAAALGLNLITANHVVLIDLWWNPTVEDQAIDRTHRIGQRREVQVYRITVKDSVEDNILKLQEKKRELVQAALGEGADGSVIAGRLTVQDIMFLFSNSGGGGGGD
jgi:SNF2 family DNA or RNA helicase